MRLTIMTLILLTTRPLGAGAAASETLDLSWSEVVRDVYINGRLDRSARVLTARSPERLALIADGLRLVPVLDLTADKLATATRESFHLTADGATSSGELSPGAGQSGFTRVDSLSFLFAVEGSQVFITRHPGWTGEMSLDQLWETVPQWRRLKEAYQPAADSVSALRDWKGDARVTVVLGTWCGDSRQYVPRLLKTLEEAGNPLPVRLIGIDYRFQEPAETIQKLQLINVPTIIVETEGVEQGRMTETPATNSAEDDLASILRRKTLTHGGRYERGARLARGAYGHFGVEGESVGREEFELFRWGDSGYLLHSRMTDDDREVDVYYRVGASYKPSMLEVTHRSNGDVSRARFSFNGQNMTVRVRGNRSGTLEQHVRLPDPFVLLAPVCAAAGWGPAPAGNESEATAEGYLAPEQADGVAVKLVQLRYLFLPQEEAQVPAGSFRVRRTAVQVGGDTLDLWLHAQLGLPVRVKSTTSGECRLTSLTLDALP